MHQQSLGGLPDPEGQAIFAQIRESRSPLRRLLSLAASIALNIAILAGLTAVAQFDSMRYAQERLKQALRRELAQYRMVLLLPAAPEKPPVQVSEMPKRPRAPKKGDRLKAAGQKLLDRMDPALAEFVRGQPALESIVTGEMIRDIDSGILDLSALLRKSQLKIAFNLDGTSHIVEPRIEESSGVPSIDHLAMELVLLLEKYPVLWALKGIREIGASIIIGDDQVNIILAAVPEDPSGIEEIRKRIQGALTLLQMGWPKEDSEFVLLNSMLVAEQDRIQLSKTFEKGPLIEYLKRFFQPPPPK